MMIKYIRKIAGIVSIIIAVIGIIGGLLEILDPVGSKMADDADPFGTPPTLAQSIRFIVYSVLLGILGVWLFGLSRGDDGEDRR
ncbi:MAG: hypothetical protein HQL30_02545 [Candidatus Omnitrophica bacterium]|nr:hypothetical protein [Candidatus Omnitrophota bacterium]